MNLQTEYGLACPKCFQTDKLHIVIHATAELTTEGTDPFGDHDWDDNSFCHCPGCDHNGIVATFRNVEVPA